MLDLDSLGLLAREVLRERAPQLIADACAWSVGLSDTPHYVERGGRLVPSGLTLGDRAENGQPLGAENSDRLYLVDARPGSFQDALNALTADGGVHADRFDADVLTGFVMDTAVQAAERLRATEPEEWAELLDEIGEDGTDVAAVVRALDWDAPLRTDAEELVVAALGHVPLLDVEREGLPLAVVRSAENVTQATAGPGPAGLHEPDEGVLFLAEAAIARAGLPRPVPAEQAERLLASLEGEGLEAEEVRAALPHLPLLADTVERVADLLDQHE